MDVAALLLCVMQTSVWDMQKIHIIPCYCKSTVCLTSPQCKVCALLSLFGCPKAGKLDQCFMQAQIIGYFSFMDEDI